MHRQPLKLLHLHPIRCVLALSLLLACALTAAAAPAPGKRHASNRPPRGPEYVAGEVLVQFHPTLEAAQRQTLQTTFHIQATDRAAAIEGFHATYQTTSLGKELFGWQRVHLPASRSVTQALSDFPAFPLVQKVEPNYLRHLEALSTTYTAYANPNDPYYQDGTVWWFNRTKSDRAMSKPYVFGNGPIIVAVVDTGADLTHPDLVARLVAGYSAITPSAQPQDDNGHGTHVTGLIAATANNALGICGTAYRSGVVVMPIKAAYYDGGFPSSAIADGVEWAANHGAKVLNMSYGGYGDSTLEDSAYTYATSKGCVLVAAAGNGDEYGGYGLDLNTYPEYPAVLSNVIAVGATDSMDQLASYSNYGVGILALSAPGGDYDDTGIYSTYLSLTYTALIGTSMATPQISAIAAMILLQNPALSPDAVRAILVGHCDDPYGEGVAYGGAGRINADAVYASYQTPTVTPTSTVTPTATQTCTPLPIAEDRIIIYPQPAKTWVKLAYHVSGPATIHVNLYNTVGERVLEFTETPYSNGGVAYTQVATDRLGPGVYFMRCVVSDSAGQRTFQRRVAVIR